MQNNADPRFFPTSFAWVVGIAGVVILLVAISNFSSVTARGDWGVVALEVYLLLAGSWMLLGLRNRPVLEIRGEEIDQGWVLWPWRRSWRRDDVMEVEGPSAWTGILRVKLRDGKTMRIPLREMRRGDRERAVELIRDLAH